MNEAGLPVPVEFVVPGTNYTFQTSLRGYVEIPFGFKNVNIPKYSNYLLINGIDISKYRGQDEVKIILKTDRANLGHFALQFVTSTCDHKGNGIKGRVTYKSGEAYPNLSVRVVDYAGNTENTLKTNNGGVFTLNIPSMNESFRFYFPELNQDKYYQVDVAKGYLCSPVINTGVKYVAPTTTAVSITKIVDTDKDGLTDQAELFYGTDPNKTDTDGNGVNDWNEIKPSSTGAGLGQEENDKKRVIALKQIRSAFDLYNAEHGNYPVAVGILGEGDFGCLFRSGFSKCPSTWSRDTLITFSKDPGSGKFVYTGNSTSYNVTTVLEGEISEYKGILYVTSENEQVNQL